VPLDVPEFVELVVPDPVEDEVEELVLLVVPDEVPLDVEL
jgi:hypothetical protein